MTSTPLPPPLPADALAQVAEVAERLVACGRVLFITGAGLSADSGLPTYRGIGGLYSEQETPEGIPIETALSGRMLRSNPELCWKYIAQIEAACRGAQPNAGHRAIARFEQLLADCWVLTQNVDGLHDIAGSQQVIDIHGDIHDLVCTECGDRQRVTDYAELSLPPRCTVCGGLVRPDVVLFGEMLPNEKVFELSRQMRIGFDAVVSIGTTSVFPYIARPVINARLTDALSVEINPGSSEVSHVVRHRIQHGGAATLDALWVSVQRRLART